MVKRHSFCSEKQLFATLVLNADIKYKNKAKLESIVEYEQHLSSYPFPHLVLLKAEMTELVRYSDSLSMTNP